MSNPEDQLTEQFAKIGFNYADLSSTLRQPHPCLAVCETKVFDPRTSDPSAYFHFSFELWRKKADDPFNLTYLAAALIGPGADSKEELLAWEYYGTYHRAIPPKETVLADLLNIRKRIEIHQKFNLGGKPPPSLLLKPNARRRKGR
jgi:hypothetical protein